MAEVATVDPHRQRPARRRPARPAPAAPRCGDGAGGRPAAGDVAPATSRTTTAHSRRRRAGRRWGAPAGPCSSSPSHWAFMATNARVHQRLRADDVGDEQVQATVDQHLAQVDGERHRLAERSRPSSPGPPRVRHRSPPSRPSDGQRPPAPARVLEGLGRLGVAAHHDAVRRAARRGLPHASPFRMVTTGHDRRTRGHDAAERRRRRPRRARARPWSPSRAAGAHLAQQVDELLDVADEVAAGHLLVVDDVARAPRRAAHA